MNTKILDLKSNNLELLQQPAEIIKNGGLVIFPTETVYGIGANGLDDNAVKKIYFAKGRVSDNPLILHISDMDMLKLIANNISDIEYKLINEFWPGPFTIILNKNDCVPKSVSGGLNTIGIRMPKNDIAISLIKYANTPIAAPSANISGRPSGTDICDIIEELKDKVDYIIDGGQSDIGIESTVVKVINNIPHILRPGKITPEQIEKVVGSVFIEDNILEGVTSSEEVLSPGIKYRHYAPNTKCILVYSNNNENTIKKINELCNNKDNILIISSNENKEKYIAKNILNIGSKSNLEEISRNIFTTLRKVDKYKVDLVIIEGYQKNGLGFAIMNRLIRACDHNYIEC